MVESALVNGGILNCSAKTPQTAPLSNWESELSSVITACTRPLGIQRELVDLGVECTISIASGSQSVIDRSGRRGHAAASSAGDAGHKNPWQTGKLVLDDVHKSTNFGDMCTEALRGTRTRKACQFARANLCGREDPMRPQHAELGQSVLVRNTKNGRHCTRITVVGSAAMSALVTLAVVRSGV